MNELLRDGEELYRVASGEKLTVSRARQGKVLFSLPLSSRPCGMFSAALSADKALYCAAQEGRAVTLFCLKEKNVTTAHLMHFPPGTEPVSLLLTCDPLTVLYSVENRNGCTAAVYRLEKNGWSGETLFSCPGKLELLCGGKSILARESTEEGQRLLLLPEGREITRSSAALADVQMQGEHVLWCTGGSVFDRDLLLTPGEGVWLQKDGCVCLRQGHGIQFVFREGWQEVGEVLLPKDWKRAIYKEDERTELAFAGPFPLCPGALSPAAAGVETEVFRQQRVIFSLEARLRALEARLARVENVLKR